MVGVQHSYSDKVGDEMVGVIVGFIFGVCFIGIVWALWLTVIRGDYAN